MTNYIDAVKEIFATFKEAWDAETTAIVGCIPNVFWMGVEQPDKPERGKYWVRVSQQTVTEEQSTFKNAENEQRYTTNGIVIAQISCPSSDSQAVTKGRELAIIARDAYRGNSTSGKVWFRNAKILELPFEKDWYIFNVTAEYEYDEKK